MPQMYGSNLELGRCFLSFNLHVVKTISGSLRCLYVSHECFTKQVVDVSHLFEIGRLNCSSNLVSGSRPVRRAGDCFVLDPCVKSILGEVLTAAETMHHNSRTGTVWRRFSASDVHVDRYKSQEIKNHHSSRRKHVSKQDMSSLDPP